MGDHLRLLMDLLFHEMAVVALVDQEGGAHRLLALALHLVAVDVEDGELVAAHHGPVAVLQIGDGVGERRQRDGVRAQEHLALAMADRQRRPVAGADDQVLVALEHDGQRKGAAQTLQGGMGGLDRSGAPRQLARHQMRDDFRVGLRIEGVAVAGQFLAQLREILDDAVVDDGDAVGEMRVRIGLVRHAVGGPAGVADADGAVQRLALQPALQIDQLALGPAARQFAPLDRGHAGGIVAAIFEALERIHDERRHRRMAHDADYSAHACCPRCVKPRFRRLAGARRPRKSRSIAPRISPHVVALVWRNKINGRQRFTSSWRN